MRLRQSTGPRPRLEAVGRPGFTLGKLAKVAEGELVGGEAGTMIHGVSEFDKATLSDITYAVNVPGIINNSGARVHVYILWEKMHTGINRSGLTN